MNDKIGRNEPCPCGSGKKFKHCHGGAANDPAPPPEDVERTVERALTWLFDHRRKALRAAHDALFDAVLRNPSGARVRGLSDDVLEQLQINLTEWLLADGVIDVKGRPARVIDELLGPDGPSFAPAQRRRLEQMKAQPLRLYTVVEVRQGEGLTLCDAIDTAAEPIDVVEDLGSRTLKPGMLIGSRVVHVDGRHELSGSMHVFLPGAASEATAAVRAAADTCVDAAHEHSGPPQGDMTKAAGRRLPDAREAMGLEIMRTWVRQFAAPQRMPAIVDAASGEAMLLITDHYRVVDADALAAAMAACPDVSGSARDGWRREHVGKDELVRSSVVVNPGKQSDRIEVFYRTQTQADEGRPWFEGVAGAAVAYLTREVTDPKSALAEGGLGALGPRPSRTSTRDALSPDDMAQAVEHVMRKYYANWCDEPIPALDNQTPRQAIATPAGLARVKGLLRSYEDGERDQSAAQGRPPFSFQFLWDGLGVTR